MCLHGERMNRMKAYKNSRIAFLLILSMLAAVWSGRAGSAENAGSGGGITKGEITEVWIQIETPSVEQELPKTATVETVTVETVSVESGMMEIFVETNTVEIANLTWLNASGNVVESGEKAKSGEEYTCSIKLEAKSKYKFKNKEDLEVYFNGNKEIRATVDGDENVLCVKYYFKVEDPSTSPSPSPTPTKTPSSTTKPATPTPAYTPTTEPDKPSQPPTAAPSEPTPAVPDTDTPDVEKPSATWPGNVFLPSPSPAVYILTLDANKGTVTDEKKKKVTKKSIRFTAAQMDTIKLPKPMRKGYIFIGWYAEKIRVEKITKAKDISLKALWMKEFAYPHFNFKKNLDSKLKWNVKVVSIEKRFKKHVKINKKKGTMKGKKYFKKAKVILRIEGEKISVTVEPKLPKPKIEPVGGKKLQYYVSGAYRRYELKYTNVKAGATRAVAEYSFKKKKGYKKCGKYQNMLKGARASVKKGKKVYFRVRIYYGKYSSPRSAPKLLIG